MNNPQLKKSVLAEADRHLIEAMQRLGFGWLHDLHLRSGHPTFTPPPRAVRDLKLGVGDAPRQELNKPDFLLKREIIELLQIFREVGTGVVAIECRHGLPARIRYELITADGRPRSRPARVEGNWERPSNTHSPLNPEGSCD